MSLTGYNPYTYTRGFRNQEFHHAVLSVSGTWHTLYLDGVQVAQNLSGGNIFASYQTITNTVIGAQTTLSQAFQGTIGDVRVYNYAIPATTVSSLYRDRELIVYYPFDTSVNALTPNYATLIYDASLIGQPLITASAGANVGSGALALSNTAGAVATQYVKTTPGIVGQIGWTPDVTHGITIACWVNVAGVAGRVQRIFDIPLTVGTKGLAVDISGTNMLYSGWNVPQKQPVSFFKLASNTTDTGSNPGSYIAGTPTYSTYSSISAITNAFTGTITINPLLSASTGFTISFWTLSNSYNNINLLLKNSSNLILSTVEFHTTEAISYINYDTAWFPSMAKYIYFPIIPDTANVWYHYVFCITNTSTTLYVNPISSFSSTPVTSSKTGSTTSFSFSASGNYMVFDRTSGVQALRNVGFYNSILTPTEVNTIWTSGLSAN